MTLMTKADYAAHHDVSKMAVTKWGRRDYLVLVGDKVDVEKSDALLKERDLGRFAKQAQISRRRREAVKDGSRGGQLTPEAVGLLDVLFGQAPSILSDLMNEYGMAPADRERAICAYIDALSYLADGLAGGDAAAQLGPVRYPQIIIPDVDREALDIEVFAIFERLAADIGRRTNPLARALAAGRNARVGVSALNGGDHGS
jgi:hypothetical protein